MFLCMIKNVYLHLFFLVQPSYSKRNIPAQAPSFFQEGHLHEMKWKNKLGKNNRLRKKVNFIAKRPK